MLEKIHKNYRHVIRSQAGFTLVELIVVLVILAILASITIPAMTGWIDKAKQKQAEVNARTLYLAAQTVVTEAYAQLDPEAFEAEFGDGILVKNEDADLGTIVGSIAYLAGIEEDYTAEIMIEEQTVVGVCYVSDNGQTVTFGEALEE